MKKEKWGKIGPPNSDKRKEYLKKLREKRLQNIKNKKLEDPEVITTNIVKKKPDKKIEKPIPESSKITKKGSILMFGL